jgi:hypothetical protein
LINHHPNISPALSEEVGVNRLIAFVKTRMSKYGKIEIPHSIENAFRIFHSSLQEYDVPQVWPDELIVRLSPVFNRLHELIVEKPLVGASFEGRFSGGIHWPNANRKWIEKT